MSVRLDLGPLERLIAQSERVGEEACGYAAEDVLGRLEEQEPVLSGALVESLAIKTGTRPGEAYAVIGPEADRTADDARSTPPARYQASVQQEHGDFMRTLLGPGDVVALADGARQALAKVLHDAAD